MTANPGFPWRGYALEPLMLALITMTGLFVVHATGAQDITRLGLTQSLLARHSLTIDPVAKLTIDRARYRGHYYSDKAPGMSIMAIPPYVTLKSADVVTGRHMLWRIFNYRDAGYAFFQRWFVRVLTGGVFFVIAVFLVGRVSEGLAPGTGALSAVAYGLGTMAGPLGATMFDHGAAATLGFAGFLAAWRALAPPASRRWLVAAGICAGFAAFFEYQAALIVALLAVYIVRAGLRPLIGFVFGLVPAVLAIAAYNTLAFDSPFRFSYRYVQNIYTAEQHQGVFGITDPSLHRLGLTLVGDRGLLLSSPILVLAGAGLVLLWRQGRRAEASLAAAVVLAFLLVESGYFLPYGGISPGPRFFAPALPFLMLGFPLAVRRWRLLTYAATVFSVVATTQILLTWAQTPPEGSVLAPRLNGPHLAQTVWEWLGAGRLTGTRIVMVTGVVSVLIAGYELLSRTSKLRPGSFVRALGRQRKR